MTIKQYKHPWQILIGGTIGNVSEWYNFLLYGYLAPTIAILFFPATSKLVSLSLTFSIFAISFLARPLGGILLGWIGDTYGRQRALMISLLMMAIPTLMIGCLPTYQSIGVLSPVLLCLLRICQGLSAGGEHTGSAIYVAEYAPRHQRSLWVSTVPASAAIGILISTLISLLIVSVFTKEQLLAWGWRTGYWFGTAICLLSLYLRYYLPETPCFNKIKKEALQEDTPLSRLAHKKKYLSNFLLVFTLASVWGVLYQIIFIWMPTFLTEIEHIPGNLTLKINSYFIFIFICLILLIGYCADHARRQYLIKLSCASMFVAAYPLFVMLSSGKLHNIYMAMTGFSLIFCLYVPTSFVCMVEAFATEVRYTGLSLAFNTGLAIFGGTCPLIATWLIEYSGITEAPAFYMMIFAFIGWLAAHFIMDKQGRSL